MKNTPGLATVRDVLGVHEYSDTAIGLEAVDAAVKAAPIVILDLRVVNPGKLLAIVTGDEASVEMGLTAARNVATTGLIEELYLPYVDPGVIAALTRSGSWDGWDAMGIVETTTIVSGIAVADIMAKRASITIAEIRVDNAMGGRASVRLVGAVGEIDTALDAARAYTRDRGSLVRAVRIANPHDDLRGHLEIREE